MKRKRNMRMVLMAATLVLLTGPAMAATKSVVFFTEWSARLDKSALAVIAGAARNALAQPQAPITVVGSADPDGSNTANDLISRLRAQMVKDALVQDGVPAARITVTGVGVVGFTQSKLESRRATIAIGK